MINEIVIKNLKAFKDYEKLKLKPITLLYGPNSSGKSSIIQSIPVHLYMIRPLSTQVVSSTYHITRYFQVWRKEPIRPTPKN